MHMGTNYYLLHPLRNEYLCFWDACLPSFPPQLPKYYIYIYRFSVRFPVALHPPPPLYTITWTMERENLPHIQQSIGESISVVFHEMIIKQIPIGINRLINHIYIQTVTNNISSVFFYSLTFALLIVLSLFSTKLLYYVFEDNFFL